MPDRREFLKRVLAWTFALLGLSYAAPAVRVLTPGRERKKETVFVPLLPEDELPRTGVRRAEATYRSGEREIRARVFLVSSPGGLLALSAVCSHLGCLVNYRRDRNEFLCPCHGGRYDRSGKNIAGPPPAPLTRFPVKIENGTIFVGMKA